MNPIAFVCTPSDHRPSDWISILYFVLELGQDMDGQEWSLTVQVASLIDLRSIGLKEVLQFGTFLGTLYGAWKWWRFSKWQIAKRLIEYLDNEEKHIIEGRAAVLRHLRYDKPLLLGPEQRLHPEIGGALKEVEREQPGRAEQRLIGFAASLTEDAKVGTRYTSNANRQAATVLLLTGLIAKKTRGDTDAAKVAWTDATQHNAVDPEVARCLAELHFEAHNDNEALRGLITAVTFAPGDKRLKAETAELRAQIYQRKGKPLLERGALQEAADNFAALDEYARAAKAYLRAAELELTPQLRMVKVAPTTLRKAYHNYFHAEDRAGAEEVRRRLIDLDEDVTSLPTFGEAVMPQFSWHWMRLAGELLLLGGIVYLLYITPR